MQITYDKTFSRHLGRDMEFKRYGHSGKPMIVFPTSGGRFYEFEDFGMIDAMAHLIDAGLIQVFTPDSVDAESWDNQSLEPEERALRHNQYDLYIVEELVPLIRQWTSWQGPLLAHGSSMGAFHALNFYLRHPDVFNGAIALSGLYDARFFVGEHFGYNVYINSPIDYLKDLSDSWYLEHYRKGDLILCCGQGDFEAESLRDTRKVADLLREKNIPAWVDIWGYEVAHDWPWWRYQLVYFLEILLEYQGILHTPN